MTVETTPRADLVGRGIISKGGLGRRLEWLEWAAGRGGRGASVTAAVRTAQEQR